MSDNPLNPDTRKNNFDGKLNDYPGTKGNPIEISVQTKVRAKEIQKQLDENKWVANITVDAKKDEDIKALELLLTPVKTYVAKKLPGRNEPCHCGSGKKFKHCHGSANPPAKSKKASTSPKKSSKK